MCVCGWCWSVVIREVRMAKWSYGRKARAKTEFSRAPMKVSVWVESRIDLSSLMQIPKLLRRVRRVRIVARRWEQESSVRSQLSR